MAVPVMPHAADSDRNLLRFAFQGTAQELVIVYHAVRPLMEQALHVVADRLPFHDRGSD